MPDSPWQLYRALIDAVDPVGELTVTDFGVAPHWAWVRTSDGHVGMGAVYPGDGRAGTGEFPVGRPLREVAALVTSWNFTEAGVGLAAINAWFNRPAPGLVEGSDAFSRFAAECAGQRVGVVGHFPGLERALGAETDLHIFERSPRKGDYPDPAAEYLLPEMDTVFITSSALVNKTMPRLLELSSAARTILVGPSTPLSTLLFDVGVDTLSAFIPTDASGVLNSLKGVGGLNKWRFGMRVNVGVGSRALLEWRNR